MRWSINLISWYPIALYPAEPVSSSLANNDERPPRSSLELPFVLDSSLDLEFSDFDRMDLSDEDEEEEEEELAQADVRSIMRSNDRLIQDLANSLQAPEHQSKQEEDEEQEQEEEEPQHEIASAREPNAIVSNIGGEKEDKGDENNEMGTDYELGKLGELVRRSIEQSHGPMQDYLANGGDRAAGGGQIGRDMNTFFLNDADADADNDGINEPFSIRLKLNRSYEASARRHPKDGERDASAAGRVSQEEAAVYFLADEGAFGNLSVDSYNKGGRDDGGGDDISAVNSYGKMRRNEEQWQPANNYYVDCDDMPECESGGRCVTEPAASENTQRTGTPGDRRARCQCPIGRGGLLCQKRK